ncbi:MAG: murein biosynthesis integral membrane protein MurJ [Acidobacteria bacterium]|nr:MAG: murein biosynthesis integral membrane protein MurJ [Acidobacteriota bacterium]PYU38988.1 MAG: murein biosynthesis integral membrane protein MurJ [Acidobacteriota bacterium]PYU71498.1 MAG: murein biosynthesis integral membrane protein MurJ [Acidobacteriota bacterium]
MVFIRVRAPEHCPLTDKKHILKSASIISLVTIVSRVLGYVREQRIALLLGTTAAADAYNLAYRIPNLFRRLVAEGSMTASFIPVFTTYMRENTKEEVWEFANRLFWTLALVVAVITILGMVFSPAVVHLFAGKNIAEAQAIELNRIVFPYLFFVALAALAMGILNCFHVFGLPAATPVCLNLATILFTLVVVRSHFKDSATAIVVGVLVGGVLQFLIQVPLLVQKGMRFNFGLSFSHPGIRNVARLMIPRLFGIGIGQINLFVDTRFATATFMPIGSLAALTVADRVMELVLGGYAIAVATAILPMMSHQAAAKDYESLKKTLAFSVRIVAFITIPAALGLMILREPIIRVLFQHGQFVAESTRLTARALLYYAVGLPALATVKLVVPAFYSTGDTKTPVIVASISLGINILLNIIFLQFFFKRVQNGGPALATAIACFFDFFALFIIFRLRYGTMGTMEILRSFGKTSLCASIMGVGCWFGNYYTAFTIHSRFLVQLLVFAGLIIGATALYLALAWLFRCHEIEEVYGIATRRTVGAGNGYAEP